MKNHLRYLINAEIDNNKKIIILSSLTLISILIFFYQLGQQYRENKNIIIFLIIILFLISMLGSLIRQIIINNKIKNDYDNLLEFMTTYEEEIENQRTLRHETKNEFLAIRAKICDKEKESEIINYIDEILGDTYSVKSEKYAKFGYLPANGIKGLCYFKVQKAEELGINVSINISKKIKKSTVFDLDLKQQREFAKILGVFIDNAIEASAESKDKELGIEAYSNLENEFRMIISNTYNNAIDEEKIGKENFTTKGKNRGHGLLLVNEIVKNNTIFETKRNIKNDIYSQTIIVKKS
ncbi:MAG: GHKL domain-containing protein [Bacilli bacterium]|nr:GHKL domain-containing protein [Bacilli bacterium]